MSPENNPTRARAKVKSDQTMKCPRCDSPNTKFCYYNNYSLTQPRHFCKTCRRYWTKGGALRNVPIGGGYRKNKKVKSSFRLSGSVDSKDSGNSSNAGLGFFNTPSPAMNLGFSRVHDNASATSLYNQFGVFFPSSSPSSLPSVGVNVDTNIAASIESLSSINQDLHWKLQQQRLALLFEGGDNTAAGHKENRISSSIVLEDHNQMLQPFPFQNMEISKPVPDQWFFGNSYGSTSVMTAGPRGDAGGSYESGGGGGFDGVQEWNDLHQYTHLP